MTNCALILLATLGMAHAGVSKNDTCLLQRPQQAQLAKSSISLLEVEVDMAGMASAMMHKAWRQQHAKLWRAMNETDGIEKFIAEQSASSQACSARLMEAKRALDRLKSEVKQLSSQVDGHEAVLETETSNLNITKLSIKSVKDNTEVEKKKCEELKKEAENEAKQFSAELEELKQIANPKETFKGSPETKTGLLQEMEWSRERCLAFVKFTEKHGYARQHDPETRDCDKQREELQKAFTKAWKEIADLHKDAEERVADTSCFDDADAAENADLVPLLTARKQALRRIENANEAIEALDPVLSSTKQRSEKLMHHIDEVLTPECFEAADVSKQLNHVRELIMALEECPGRHNFKLKIPAEPEDSEAVEPEVAVLPTITPKVLTPVKKPYEGEINLPEPPKPKETVKTLDYAPVQQRS